MAFDPKKVYLSPAPHFSAGETTRGIMLKVVAALAPLCVCGVVLFGAPAAVTIAVSVAGCVGFETAFRKLSRQESRAGDLSAAVTGVMLALTLPPSTPAWMTLLGALFSVVVAKEFFGGLGANVFNPALTGRAFLLMSFPVALTTWTKPFDAVTGATLLPKLNAVGEFADAASGAAETVEASRLAYFIGNRAGCIGETSVLLILLAFLFLLATKVIDWRAPVAMIAATAGLTALFGGDPFWAVLSGGLLFGAVFMTTDYATSPVTKGGKLVFGAGCGVVTFLIRRFGGYPEGVMFSILIMNIIVPFLNNIVPHKYGYVKPAKKAAGGTV